MKKRFVVHDWDDTITNSFQTYSGWYSEFARRYNFNIPDVENIKNLWGNTVADIMSSLWPSLDNTTANILLKEFWHSGDVGDRYTPKVFDGVKDTFLKLKNVGYEFGILSAGKSFAIEKAYKKHLFEDTSFHKFIITEEYCNYHKPDPRVFDDVTLELIKHDATLDDILYVGDSLIDYFASRDKGIDFIAVTTGIHSKDDFINAGLDKEYILNTFNELLSMVK